MQELICIHKKGNEIKETLHPFMLFWVLLMWIFIPILILFEMLEYVFVRDYIWITKKEYYQIKIKELDRKN